MSLNPSYFQRITGLTDLLLGALALILLIGLRPRSSLKAKIWIWAFGLLAVASFLGAFAHGLDMSETTRSLIWQPLNLSLGFSLGMFIAGALDDWKGAKVARKAIPFLVGAGIVFYLVTVFIPGTFIVFIAYEGAAMLFALVVYSLLASKRSLPGAEWMVPGILVTIIAAVVQATGIEDRGILWYFDNNGVFHLIQIVGIVFLYIGVKKDLK